MGWTGSKAKFPGHGAEAIRIVEAEIGRSMDEASATFCQGEWVVYGAVHSDRLGRRIGLVTLIERGDPGWVMVKFISEDMGPMETRATPELIKLLNADGPALNEWSADWRAACLEGRDRRRIELRHGGAA